MKEAKSTLKGVTLVEEAPQSGNASGRLVKNVHYMVIGYGKVAKTKNFEEWKGILVERLDTMTQTVIGTNTMLGTAIRFVGIGKQGASEKGYVAETFEDHPFTSVNDFAPRKIDGKLYANGTIFTVTDIKQMNVNKFYNPDLDKTNPTKNDLELREKDFYTMQIVSKEEKTKEVAE